MRRPWKAVLGSFLFAAAVLAVGVTVEAQQPKKVSRIGFPSSATPAGEFARFEAIRLSLRELRLLTLFNRPVKKGTQAHAQ
jgi:hypothetical protein